MAPKGTELRWGVEQRLEFIEFRLFWEGGINRADITGFFGVSVPQASKDLSQYQELAPHNLRYDRSEKRYFAAPTFKPLYLKPDADRYLTELARSAEPAAHGEQSWLLAPPSIDTLPLPHRRVETSVLRPLLEAIREERAVEIFYQSMNNQRPDPIWRAISPHAFGSDGLRWHVRAYCHLERKFKDYILSRCIEVRASDEKGARKEDDKGWNEFFDVILEPNPALSENQRKVIALDYDMEDGRTAIPVRRALLYYFQKRLRLDVAEALDDPKEAPVVVMNRAGFKEALEQASR